MLAFHALLDCGHICTCITTLKLHSLLVERELELVELEDGLELELTELAEFEDLKARADRSPQCWMQLAKI